MSRLEECFCRESQNHKMTGFGRDLRSSLLLKAQPAVGLERVAQGFIQLDPSLKTAQLL